MGLKLLAHPVAQFLHDLAWKYRLHEPNKQTNKNKQTFSTECMVLPSEVNSFQRVATKQDQNKVQHNVTAHSTETALQTITDSVQSSDSNKEKKERKV